MDGYGRSVRQRRVALGLSQFQLARATGCSQCWISGLENFQFFASADDRLRINAYLDTCARQQPALHAVVARRKARAPA
jgi:transcriptional regulator with XRE-family HTH domain